LRYKGALQFTLRHNPWDYSGQIAYYWARSPADQMFSQKLRALAPVVLARVFIGHPSFRC